MARAEKQKVKTLFVAKYFLENSDENLPMKTTRSPPGTLWTICGKIVGLKWSAAPSTGI